MKWWLVLVAAFFLTGCETREVKREIGYKGRARVNPWLAAERFCEAYPGQVRSLAGWTEPTADDAVWWVPANLLGNASFTRRLTAWVEGGGHLVMMVDHAETAHDDWQPFPPATPPHTALTEMLKDFGLRLVTREQGEKPLRARAIRFEGKRFQVEVASDSRLDRGDGKNVAFASVKKGLGRMSVVTDGRIFRNRWLGKAQHADLLDALVGARGRDGDIGFTRGDGLSLWSLASQHLWPVLAGLVLWLILWLWKNLVRFGPLEASQETSVLRGYDHHLGALGDFQWRLDKAAGLLAPLRSQVMERGQRACLRSHPSGGDLSVYLAELAGLPHGNIVSALKEDAPPDAATLARTTADLQRLLRLLH